jgi:hypothetical protein
MRRASPVTPPASEVALRIRAKVLVMQLPESRFDGVFANASLFHVPSQELPKVLLTLIKALKPLKALKNPPSSSDESPANLSFRVSIPRMIVVRAS